MGRPRQYDSDQAASTAGAVRDFDSSAVGLDDLTRENKPNSTPSRFCRIERGEHIRRIQKTRAIVFDQQIHIGFRDIPSNSNLSIHI
jgi:hypothetical protein